MILCLTHISTSYYDNALHSTYFWDKEDGGFACAVLIKKEVDKSKGVKRGTWDSINVVDVTIDKAKQRVNYRVTTTAMLSFVIENETAGEVTLAGTYTKQVNTHTPNDPLLNTFSQWNREKSQNLIRS